MIVQLTYQQRALQGRQEEVRGFTFVLSAEPKRAVVAMTLPARALLWSVFFCSLPICVFAFMVLYISYSCIEEPSTELALTPVMENESSERIERVWGRI